MENRFEVYSNSAPNLDEVGSFWMREWDKNFMKLVGQRAKPEMFMNYDFHYVLRFNGKIGAIMSSAWQNSADQLQSDSYYSAWTDAHQYLIKQNIINFQKMGMIAADPEVIPKGFKMTRVLIGCGMKFTSSHFPDSAGVVSFPRPDTSVYKACVEWGARTVKSGLQMYNVPVNFIVLLHSELRQNHENKQIQEQVDSLWQNRWENISDRLVA